MLRKLYRQRLLVAVLCGLLAMNYPLLMLASQSGLIFGFPALYLYLFGVWLLMILSVKHLVRQLQRYNSDNSTGQDPNA